MTPQNNVSDENISIPSSGSSSEPMRFRNLNDIYGDTVEIELDDSDVEALLVETGEPICYKEAAEYQDWVDAMNKEMESIEKNKTWALVKLPVGKSPLV
jgi:hypothetical protein